MIGLGLSIFGVLVWLAFTLVMVIGGGAILFGDDYYYDYPPRWTGFVMLMIGLLSGSFMLAALISS